MNDLDLIDRRIAAELMPNATLPNARIAEELDYLLHVSVQDIAAFDTLHKRLPDGVPIRNVTSHLAIERMTFSTVHPVDTRNR